MVFTWAFLLLCGWLAATVSGTAGFGGALLLLPVLTFTVGARAAVPILTVAQLLGNLSRAGFGWREIRWKPAVLFCAGAVPGSVLGARIFIDLPPVFILRLIGLFLLCVVALRHTPIGTQRTPEWVLGPAGAVVGLLSALAGSAGPLAAVLFLGLHLPQRAYVASEAVTAVVMHLIKGIVYVRFAAVTFGEVAQGLALGGSLVLGSWTGRKLIDRLPQWGFGLLVEALLVGSAVVLVVRKV